MTTVLMMKVKVLPLKLTDDSQPVHDDPTRNSGGRSWKLGRNQISIAENTDANGEFPRRKRA